MIIVSDTNILSSLAAGASLPAFVVLYQRDKLVIPPSVQQEAQAGFARGKAYLQPVLQAIQTRQIEVIQLSAEEELLTFKYPSGLNAGEREALALAQTRKAVLLSNDRAAQRYCAQRGMRCYTLADVLRLLWVEQILSPDEVRGVMSRMEQVESHAFTAEHLTVIFAPVATEP